MYSTIQSSICYQVRVKTGGNVCLVKRLSLMNPATTTHRSNSGASCTDGGSADPLRFNNKNTRLARSNQSGPTGHGSGCQIAPVKQAKFDSDFIDSTFTQEAGFIYYKNK